MLHRSFACLTLQFCVALVWVSLAGCDSSGLGSIVPVQGKVLLNDTPLATGSLVFEPDAGKGNQSPFQPAAEITSDGSYRLYTKEREGAPPGWYKVGVVAEGPASATDPYAPRTSLVAKKFTDPETSGLSVEVVPNSPANAYDLKLTK